jgi:predicted transcriptional regulator
MIALLSIKPEFVAQIFAGTKRYEFRRVVFKQPVKKVVVYSSAPEQMIVGEFDVEGVIHNSLDDLWRDTEHASGISASVFYSYFCDKDSGYAIKIGNVLRYQEPTPLNKIYPSPPPQSFAYLSPDLLDALIQPDGTARRSDQACPVPDCVG